MMIRAGLSTAGALAALALALAWWLWGGSDRSSLSEDPAHSALTLAPVLNAAPNEPSPRPEADAAPSHRRS